MHRPSSVRHARGLNAITDFYQSTNTGNNGAHPRSASRDSQMGVHSGRWRWFRLPLVTSSHLEHHFAAHVTLLHILMCLPAENNTRTAVSSSGGCP